MTNVTDEVLGKLARQMFDLFRRVRDGSLDPSAVSSGLQAIIEGKHLVGLAEDAVPYLLQRVAAHGSASPQDSVWYPQDSPWNPQDAPLYQEPSWYIRPKQQLAHMRKLNARYGWGLTEADFAAVTAIPRPILAKDEVLLLAVTLPKKGRQSSFKRTLTELWAAVEAPAGHRKVTYWDPSSKPVQLAPGYRLPRPGLRWVVFTPNAYPGCSPKSLWEEGVTDLATVETLSALLMFPEWPMAWGAGNDKFPNLAALRCGTVWSDSPCLGRWDAGREFGLGSRWAGNGDPRWASPAVREC